MMIQKSFMLVLGLAMGHLALCQVNIQMISGMDGVLLLEDGSTTNYWGYGYDGPGGGLEMPAPLIELEVGDDVELSFNNVSAEAHTIHLHGMDVNQANDGVPSTSFQVFQNQSGTYTFTATEPGTYLYHCHVTTTLHLTMGMYGMIIVHEQTPVLFAGGPGFSNEYAFLFSDLEVAVNDVPTAAFPFHDIDPDYFMVNGLQGEMITSDPSQTIAAHAGDSIALRLGSMAYSKIQMHFPSALNAVVYMSDGRVLPQEITTNDLEIYPGERFSVMCYPTGDFAQPIEVEYVDMLSGEIEHANMILINNLDIGIQEQEDVSKLVIFPNPTSGLVHFESMRDSHLDFYNAQGKRLYRCRVNKGANRIDLGFLGSGIFLVRDDRNIKGSIIMD
ncbi:MAG: plastocyanin [Flavobacteriales bacterium]|jgi:plastocyanin